MKTELPVFQIISKEDISDEELKKICATSNVPLGSEVLAEVIKDETVTFYLIKRQIKAPDGEFRCEFGTIQVLDGDKIFFSIFETRQDTVEGLEPWDYSIEASTIIYFKRIEFILKPHPINIKPYRKRKILQFKLIQLDEVSRLKHNPNTSS